MLKETLLFAGGVLVGAAVIYGAYRYYQHRKASDTASSTESESFAEKLKVKEEKAEAHLISSEQDKTGIVKTEGEY